MSFLTKPIHIQIPQAAVDRVLLILSVTFWVVLLYLKARSISLMSFHWDEFWFLSLVHAGARGELSNGFQMLHVLFFSWLIGTGDEIDQLRLGRWVMWGLMTMSSGLLFMLARRWCRVQAALFAPVAFLASYQVMAHGASFRTDSMLLPLTLGVLLALSCPSRARTPLWLAGALWGLAVTLSIKAVLLAPVAGCVLWAARRPSWRQAVVQVMWVGLAAAICILVLVALQQALMTFASSAETVAGTVADTGSAMFSSWIPRKSIAEYSISLDWRMWWMMGLGALACLLRRSLLAGLALSLLPILFYRNAFGYYYVLMLAPASVLVALLGEEIYVRAGPLRRWPRLYQWLLAGMLFGLYSMASYNASVVYASRYQDKQVHILRALHRMFPSPVPYIDHSGVVASFPKVNGFLSTLGLENYNAAGQPFMPPLLVGQKPPLLLADRDVLTPDRMRHQKLLPLDQKLIASTYVHYWGPVWVAGASLPSHDGKVHLPFDGSYRLQSSVPVVIDGVLRQPNAVVVVKSNRLGLEVHWPSTPAPASLVWAKAGRPPEAEEEALFFSLPR